MYSKAVIIQMTGKKTVDAENYLHKLCEVIHSQNVNKYTCSI